MDSFKQIHLQQTLTSLGNVVALNRYVGNLGSMNKSLQSFEENFKRYNPRKKGNPRYGLSITSLHGDFSNDVDMDSLHEYNKENGTKFDEGDFRKWTPFYKDCKNLQKVMEPFHEYMGRSHVLRLDSGGFFPPHRDSFTLTPGSFRLFISLCGYFEKYCFLLDDKKMFF